MTVKSYPSEYAAAQRVADGVNAYWQKLGYDVNARVETRLSHHVWGARHESYEVVSDTVNGLPRGFKRGRRSA